MLELASRAGDVAGNAPLSGRVSIWSWQAPAWFASGAPYPYFAGFAPNAYYKPFVPQSPPSGGGPPTVRGVVNTASAAIASGPAFSAFREPAL